MKKILFLVLAICALAFMLVSCSKGTEGLEFVEINDEEYGVKCGEAINEGEIIIPKKHDGKAVTTILKSGFAKCENSTSITIPSTVTKMEMGAFLNCDKLENVYYNGTLEKWSSIKFEHSTANPMSLASHFFIKDEELTELSFDNVTEIQAYAFFGFDAVTKISINSDASIGENAFAGCSSLSELVLSNKVKYIGKLAFASCINLESVFIPSGVVSIHPLAFYGCKELTDVTFEVTEGWFLATNFADTHGIATDVTDTSKNALSLRERGTRYWKRNK